jgi:hypothetical protein
MCTAARLAGLNTTTTQVAGEQFNPFLPDEGVEKIANSASHEQRQGKPSRLALSSAPLILFLW